MVESILETRKTIAEQDVEHEEVIIIHSAKDDAKVRSYIYV